MIPLYPLEYNAATGLYSFFTQKGVRYICRFKNITSYLSPILGVYDLEIFDFEFYPENEIEKGQLRYDAAISATICNLFDKFFTSDLRILVYICSSSDDKHRQRHELFRKWHYRYVAAKLERVAVEIRMEDDIIYGAVLFKHEFPYMHLLQHELIDKADDILMEKMGF